MNIFMNVECIINERIFPRSFLFLFIAKSCVTCAVFYLYIILLIKVTRDIIYNMYVITRGSGSKNGPIHNNTLIKIPQDIKLASWVCPPTVCWINDLDNEAVIGMQEKKEPTRFPNPCKKYSVSLLKIFFRFNQNIPNIISSNRRI